jgi:hypothetical protein
MDPPIENSVVQINQGCWLFGSTFICESGSEAPADALKTWEQEDGNIYYLRTITEHDDMVRLKERDGPPVRYAARLALLLATSGAGKLI